MNTIQIVSIAFLFTLFFSCADEETDSICVYIDQRQCQIDPWSSVQQELGGEVALKEYLETNGITVLRMEVEESFHEVVCLACVCPGGPRYSIELSMADFEKLSSLDILFGALDDCF